MEALAISAANLDTIEKNLGSVANELSNVVTNVQETKYHMDDIENRVDTLNDSIDNLIKEIRETTVITDARQSIMYNDSLIEKKYGYYDNVRRTTLSLIDAVNNSNISSNALVDLKNQLLLNNPNYWLANSLSAVTFWLLNDKDNCQKELTNSLRKNEEKTSLFFTLLNLKFNRIDTSIHWLSKYLQLQNPTQLDSDFIIILDLVASGTFGNDAKNVVLNKIDKWINELQQENYIQENNINKFKELIYDNSYKEVAFNNIESYVKDSDLLFGKINITSSYERILNYLQSIINRDGTTKTIDKILEDLIFEYEEQEQEYKKENRLNTLIIKYNGNREEAQKQYNKEIDALNNKVDLLTLFTNITINKDLYNLSLETQKIILSYIVPFIKKSYLEINNTLINNDLELNIDDFTTRTNNGTNNKEIDKELNLFIDNKYVVDDKDLLVILIIVNLMGIIGIFLTINSGTIFTILIIFLIISDILLLSKLFKRNNINKLLKEKYYKDYNSKVEVTLAEIIDYNNLIKNNMVKYDELMTFLDNLNVRNYVNNNGERNIDISGE